MATNNNSKPAAELRIGTVKATVWENEVGGITHHNVTFSRIYPEGASGKPRRASLSSTCSPLPSSPTRHTRSLPSARPRRPRRLAITKPVKRLTFRRRVQPRRLFCGRPCWREAGTRFQRRSRRRILQQTLPGGASRKRGTVESETVFFRSIPGNVPARARISGQNPFMSIESKSELPHRECVGVDAIENDSPVRRRLSRSDFATERAQTCTYCGEIISCEE